MVTLGAMWNILNSLVRQDPLYIAKVVAPAALLALFWCWETWSPYFRHDQDRVRHAARNLAIAVLNTVILSLTFTLLIVRISTWAESNRLGLLHILPLSAPL